MVPVATVKWLKSADIGTLSSGTTFGVPWPKGLYFPGQAFSIDGGGQEIYLDSREIAQWADGSLKWTVHSVSGELGYSENYTIKGTPHTNVKNGVSIINSTEGLLVTTQSGLELKFGTPGKSRFLEYLSIKDSIVCSGGNIVSSINGNKYLGVVKTVAVENFTFSRVVVKISGDMIGSNSSDRHLPFDVRFYVYADATPVKIIHSFIHDLDADKPLTSLGLQFVVPLKDAELYNRHVRFGGSKGGILKEAVVGLTGLRHGPTDQNRVDQVAGREVLLRKEDWARTELEKGLSYIPAFQSYSLSQLTSDGFTLKKRTKPHCSWVKVTGGNRADGTVFLGTPKLGGIGLGMSDFWERYPTQLDLTELDSEEGIVTVWLYSPLAEPLDTSPYHDGLGLDTYAKQLEALDVTYEDYEPGFGTANGIARTNQIFLMPFVTTPTNQELGSFSSLVRDPPRLVPTVNYMHSAGVFHGCWAPDYRNLALSPSKKEEEVDRNLDLLFNYYKGQVEQHRWYGFLDHGDVQHTYDPYRHTWRYDVGGFAWDNSELSTDLWLWLYFLHTGRADVFKMAEAMTRHTGEVDVYHEGRFKGFGTRHGVQHFSCSSKQLRISSVLYRRVYFYLTGDERTGDLITELQDCQKTLLMLDSHRKVQQHAEIPKGFAMTNIGLDCGALFASWLTAWERRANNWERSRDLVLNLLDGIANLKHGIANNAILLHPNTGEVRECPPPTPEYAISHLSMLFGFPEIVSELLNYAEKDYPEIVKKFKKIWLSYCRAYNGGPEVQRKEFGFEFPPHATWRQSHSTLTALAAVEENDPHLAHMAWDQFFNTDGYTEAHDWIVNKASAPEFFTDGEEAPWITTNEVARYGVSAISNLGNIRKYL